MKRKYKQRQRQMAAMFAQGDRTVKACLEYMDITAEDWKYFYDYANKYISDGGTFCDHETYQTKGTRTEECAMSYYEIGAEMGFTATRARELVSKALRKLKHPSNSRHLRSFIYG